MPLRLTTSQPSPDKVGELLSEAHSNTSDLSVHTTQLSRDRPLSIREQLHDAFNTSTPVSYFRANISTPEVSMPGASLKVAVAVAILPLPPGHLYHFLVPDIMIAQLTFRLRSYTGLRVQRILPRKQKPPKSYTFKKPELETRQSTSDATFTPRNGA